MWMRKEKAAESKDTLARSTKSDGWAFADMSQGRLPSDDGDSKIMS